MSSKVEISDQQTFNQQSPESPPSDEKGLLTSSENDLEQTPSQVNKKYLLELAKEALAFVTSSSVAIANDIKRRFSNPVLASNSYRYLARQIVRDLNGIEKGKGKTIVFSSSTTMQTNSEVLLMFSHFLQDELSCSILIIDASFTGNGLTQLLDLGEREGIMDALFSKEPWTSYNSVIHPLKENISFIAGGNVAKHHVPYVSEQQVRSIIDELTKYFDYVIFQQDQIQLDTRYLPFAKTADMVLLHLEERNTPITSFDEIKEIFSAHQINNVKYLLSEP